MDGTSRHWHELTPSRFPWEREALEFVRKRFPATPTHRAWTNFEFIAPDGSINEIDMLVVTPRGVFVVEIKSWPERIEGDQGTWYRVADGRRRRAEDNPLLLANRKAKRLKSLLEANVDKRMRDRLPFIKALVFLSHPEVQPRLDRSGLRGVTVRDADEGRAAAGGLPGIVETLCQVTAEDRAHNRFRALRMRDAELLAGALEAAGIRESKRHRRVGDYELSEMIDEGPGYQEYAAQHASLPDAERRIRIFTSSSGIERELVVRAAKREFRSLDSLMHPGILTPREYVEHELGPALIYDREPEAIALDHYLAVHGSRLDLEARLELVRAIAEALAYANAQKVIHRALSPRAVLISPSTSGPPRIHIRDWHTAYRAELAGTTTTATRATSLERLVPQSAAVYLAPEASRSRTGEHLDVFSLGAIAFHVFTGSPPAESLIDRQGHLDQHGGLDIGTLIDGTVEEQRMCVLLATCPEVGERTESVKAFLSELDEIEDRLTEPASDEEIDPTTAAKGDCLLDYKIEARLGSGASSVAYLVEDGGEKRVLKVAVEPARNKSLRTEAEALAKVRAPGIVRLYRSGLEIRDHAAILIEHAGEETLADRIKREGPLGLELLERLGEDLIRFVSALEDQGIYHRDIKPANIGIGRRGRSNQLRLVLFDFSLSRAPLDAISVGTPAYLDPFLAAPNRGRFDLHAERFAAAMTLHEMATGQLPRWGDGLSDPNSIDAEVSIDLALLGPVGKPLADFFKKALARSTKARFDTAEDMLRAWRGSFAGADRPVPTDRHEEPSPLASLRSVSGTTPIRELALSPRAINALERAGILAASALVETPEFELRSLAGVGAGTREELVALHRTLQEVIDEEEAPDVQGLDLLVRQLVPQRGWDEEDIEVLRKFLGLSGPTWMDVGAVARATGKERAAVLAVVDRARERWAKSLRSVTRLRDEIAEMLEQEGGLLPAPLLEEGVLSRRGAAASGEERSRLAAASARAALETEMRRENPRFQVLRVGDVVVALSVAAVEDFDAARDYLREVGARAAELVVEKPIDHVRAVEELAAVPVPPGVPPSSHARLVRLAASIEPGVAANDRGELYPVGMDSKLALRRIAGSFAGEAGPTLPAIEQKLLARYPDAGPLPLRDEIDAIFAEFAMYWDPAKTRYLPRSTGMATTRSTSLHATNAGVSASAFDERLARSHDRFLALTAALERLAHAERTLSGDRRLTPIRLDAVLIEQMQAIAMEKKADWQAILKVDAAGPKGRHWRVLADLAATAGERLRAQLLQTEGTVLASRAGLLVRYGQIAVLEDLKRELDRVDPERPLKGLWLLVPTNDGPPRIEGHPWPVIDENEWAPVPSAWLSGEA